MVKFLVGGVVVVRDDRNAVQDLEPKRVNRVVHNHNVLGPHVSKQSQVLYVHVVVRLETAVSVQSMLDQFSVGIEQVEDSVRVSFHRSRPNDHEEVFSGFSEALFGVRANVDPGLDRLGLVLKLDGQDVVRALFLNIVHAMNQGLVHVKDDHSSLVPRNIDLLFVIVFGDGNALEILERLQTLKHVNSVQIRLGVFRSLLVHFFFIVVLILLKHHFVFNRN